jgi:hypothetical protein
VALSPILSDCVFGERNSNLLNNQSVLVYLNYYLILRFEGKGAIASNLGWNVDEELVIIFVGCLGLSVQEFALSVNHF